MHPPRTSTASVGTLSALLVLFALPLDSHAQRSFDSLPSTIVTHPDLEVSLFAMEPDVVDPVALCFDAAGRMYVVEMRDYPYGIPPENRPGGTVRLLEDTDGDGRADRSVLFAEGLSFPTSIAPYRDGVLVASPPEIVFLRDTDGDGKADEREALFGGFAREVTDSNFSGLRWGLDNWLHGVNGGNGGMVSSSRGNGEPVRLGDLDFRLQPDTGQVETTFSTGGGFGLVFDDWGRSFTPHNINHMQMRIMESDRLSRHGGLPPIEGTHSISDHGEMARIFPISEARTRPNHPEQAGRFSSSGGMGFIGHSGYPGDLPGSLLVCDVVGNLVHRDVLTEDGPIFKASRAPGEEDREFLASTDPRFRPTGVELGPDGALYLMDMHRDVIEHPDYIPKKMLAEMDIRAGDDKGRIYRIVPGKGLPRVRTDLMEFPARELVDELASPNQWRRMTAQRLLVERRSVEMTGVLRSMAKEDANPVARVHALWTLAGLERLKADDVVAALDGEGVRVVENALQLAEPFVSNDEAVRQRVFWRLLALAEPPRLKFLALQVVEGVDLDALVKAVADVLKAEGGHPWSRRAALAALPDGELTLLGQLVADGSFLQKGFAGDVLRELSDLAGARFNDSGAAGFTEVLKRLGDRTVGDEAELAVLDGLNSGLGRNRARIGSVSDGGATLDMLANGASVPVQRAVWNLERTLDMPVSNSQSQAVRRALRVAIDRDGSVVERVEAIELLELGELPDTLSGLLKCMGGNEPAEIQSAAFSVLQRPTDVAIADGLLEGWRSIHPALKRGVVLLLLRRRAYHEPLVTALESGRLTVGELNLDLEDRRTLLRWSTDDIHERAKKLLGDGEYGNRQAKVDEWMAKLPEKGDAARGRAVFETLCATCHRSGDLGVDVGPDLSSVSHRSVEDLVSNILDPNMAINPNYQAVTIETADGEIVTGIIAAESAEAITLSLAGGVRSTLVRSDIGRMESAGRSLMPEGIEAGMTPESLRDLVKFLRESH